MQFSLLLLSPALLVRLMPSRRPSIRAAIMTITMPCALAPTTAATMMAAEAIVVNRLSAEKAPQAPRRRGFFALHRTLPEDLCPRVARSIARSSERMKLAGDHAQLARRQAIPSTESPASRRALGHRNRRISLALTNCRPRCPILTQRGLLPHNDRAGGSGPTHPPHPAGAATLTILGRVELTLTKYPFWCVSQKGRLATKCSVDRARRLGLIAVALPGITLVTTR